MLHDHSPLLPRLRVPLSDAPSTVSAFAACRRGGSAKADFVSQAWTGCPGTVGVASSSFCATWANLRISCSESNAASTRDGESDLLNDPPLISQTSPARAFRASMSTCAVLTPRQAVQAARSNIHIGTSRSRSDRRPVRLHLSTASQDLPITSWT